MESHESERDAVVNLHLKKKWFDKIKSGQKKHEYRLATPYWEKRLNRRIKVSLYCGAKSSLKASCTLPRKKHPYFRVFFYGFSDTRDGIDSGQGKPCV